jgi:hypothetical protein
MLKFSILRIKCVFLIKENTSRSTQQYYHIKDTSNSSRNTQEYLQHTVDSESQK